jgi:hypothetical protein
VHLVDLLHLRARPFAGLFLGLTRRCPLHCAHCSTNSTMASEHSPAEWYDAFVDTFRADDRPEVMLLSGGEPLLRPDLVVRLTERARGVGTRVSLLTGGFWGERAVPPAVQRAMDAVDLLSVSMDPFHEQEVPRASVFATIERRLEGGRDVSVQTVGAGDDDPWVAQLVDELESRFACSVPILVGLLGPSGRDDAPGLETPVPLPQRRSSLPRFVDDVAPEPCSFASWPVGGFDGTITACCQQSVVDAAPGHLRLGHLATESWPDIRERGERSALLRAIRVYGPQHLAARVGRGITDYCGTCRTLDDDPEVARLADEMTSTPGFAFTADFVADSLGTLPLRGVPARYTELVGRGAPAPVEYAPAEVAAASSTPGRRPEGIEGW